MIGFITLIRKEISRFAKVWIQTVFTPLINAFLYLLIFGISLSEHIQVSQGYSYLEFLIPGLMMMGIMNNAFQNSSSSVAIARFTGDLEDLRVIPVKESTLVWAYGFGAVFRGGVVGLVTYLVGSVFHYLKYGTVIDIHHPLEFLFFVIVAGLIFGFLGVIMAFRAKTFDQLNAFSAFFLLPLTYLGGVFYPLEALPEFWQSVSRMNPLLYLIGGLRYSIIGAEMVNINLGYALSLVFAALTYFMAVRTLKTNSFSRW